MNYFIKPQGATGKDSKKDNLQTKLYVAYINRDAVNDPDDLYSEEISRDSRSYKASAFISSGEMMSDKHSPLILSHDEEMMLFDEEY
jgi:hypothetical protein